MITSADGEDLEINSSGGRRQKRDVVDDFDLSLKSSGGKRFFLRKPKAIQ